MGVGVGSGVGSGVGVGVGVGSGVTFILKMQVPMLVKSTATVSFRPWSSV